MSKVRSPKRIAVALAVSVLLSLSLAGGAYADSSEDIATGALTPPPPVELNLNSSINLLAYTYLLNYSSSISKVGSTQVSISGFTGAGQTVDQIGISYIIQRWTGSEWVDIGSSSDSGTNRSSLSGVKNFSVTAGYYYRGKTTHWVSKSGTYESGNFTTNSVLVEK